MSELFRPASEDGEILKVKVLAGIKVLVALDDKYDLVQIQLWRRVRLVELPPALRGGYAAQHRHVNAGYTPLPDRGDCSFGFSLDGSLRRVVYLQDLPEEQVVDVLPEQPLEFGNRVLLRPQPVGSPEGELVYA